MNRLEGIRELVLQSDDSDALDHLAERLREAGSEVEGPVTHDGGNRSIYLSDPEGNRLELWDYFEREDGAGGPPDAR